MKKILFTAFLSIAAVCSMAHAADIKVAAVEFNPNAISGWALILANERAPLTEKIKAQTEILRLDPFNYEIRDLKLTAP